IAIPSYQNQIQKTRRADAQSALLNAAQQLERCFTRFNSYNAADCTDPAGDSPDGFYEIKTDIEATTYTLTAEPQGRQVGDRCGTFTLDHLGNRTPAPNENRCWGS
ncbi:MAG: type IV pilin protein, partial [Wenzhouxiangella sp.]